MVSVFFNCSSPYVGFRLLQADYVQEKMVRCTEKEMTPTGYKVFNASGSYMLLGTFHGRRYFHSCESRTENYDEQGRPIYNSMAFLAGTPADAPIINAIAAYVFFNEDAFYAEMARYITLLDDGYTVDFKALAAFLKRFEQGCEIQTKSMMAKRCFNAILASEGSYAVDFIVRQSTWNYFVKQVGKDFTKNEQFNLSGEQGRSLAAQGTVVFRTPAAKPAAPAAQKPKAPVAPKPAVPAARKPQASAPEKPAAPAPEKPAAPVQPAPQPAPDPQQAKLAALQEENDRRKQQLGAAEEKIAALTAELARVKEALKKHFLMGIAAGIIGTVLAVLVLGPVSGCMAAEVSGPTAQHVIAEVEAAQDYIYPEGEI